MIYTTNDNFNLTDDELQNSLSRKDGIDKATEYTVRIHGCDPIQESGALLKLRQAMMATGQVLFHRFYCKKSFAHFNVKKAVASRVWHASKLEESTRKSSDCISFLRPTIALRKIAEYFFGTTYHEISTLRSHHVKSIGGCRKQSIRARGAVVACGVVYAAARRFQAPLPENQPWWKEFDAEISGIDDVCKVLAHLYSLPKAQYISVCKDGKFSSSNMLSDSQLQPVLKLLFSDGAWWIA